MLWHAFQHRNTSARWLLAAWLCVLLISVAAPFARAQSSANWDPVCSATGATFLVPGPTAADELATPSHGVDCALCLPMLAPPPAQSQDAGQSQQAEPLPVAEQGAVHVFASTLPPVRAPPSETFKTIAKSH